MPVHLHRRFRETFGYTRGMFPAAEEIGGRVVALPLYPKLKAAELKLADQA